MGAQTFVATIANARAGAAIELHTDAVGGPLLGTLQAGTPAPGVRWQERTTTVSGATGLRDLYMVFRGKGDDSLMDVDSWRFTR